MREFRKIAIRAESVACTIAFAIGQPADVDVSEIIVRPTASAYGFIQFFTLDANRLIFFKPVNRVIGNLSPGSLA